MMAFDRYFLLQSPFLPQGFLFIVIPPSPAYHRPEFTLLVGQGWLGLLSVSNVGPVLK